MSCILGVEYIRRLDSLILRFLDHFTLRVLHFDLMLCLGELYSEPRKTNRVAQSHGLPSMYRCNAIGYFDCVDIVYIICEWQPALFFLIFIIPMMFYA
jgi:hypothetical protein